MLLIRSLFALLLTVPVLANGAMPKGEYLDAQGSKVGVILAHGRGGDPDSNVVGPLRHALHSAAYHTLSLQMPNPEAGRPIDPVTFPEAYENIRAAVEFLKKERNVERVYLLGYSMGARTTSGYLANQQDHGIAGFVGIGVWGGGKPPFNANVNLRSVRVPVLDLYAPNDAKDAKFAAVRKALMSDTYQQLPIDGATHSFKGYDSALAAAVKDWLSAREAAARKP
jgi:predicted alpha/beta-hydrolase family hydrolase